MTLPTGARLGPYEILAAIGAGGMGEVYKARDSRLDRVVAIKILPDRLAGDDQFRERFDREARVVSQLDHPNICSLYDIGDERGTAYLVMQYLEGETLESRLKKGPLALEQALKTAIEIAAALDAAHRVGIVHRDLKPGNVILTKSGAKLLDFGLAKALSAGGQAGSMLQTTPGTLTAQGTILGTFQYMAPEQIEGLESDARSDIFAFGAVIYEMLTGRKAFEGKSQASLLGAILRDEAPRVSQAQPMTPPALDYLIRTCLAKDPEARFQTAHDVALQLRWIAEGGSAAGVPAPVVSHRRSRERMAWAIAAALAIVAAGTGLISIIHLREQPAQAARVQFTIPSEESSRFRAPADFAVSPDGQHLVFAGITNAPNSARPAILFVRSLSTFEPRALPGTEDAFFPFWSPDSRYIGFFKGGRLMKVDINGGPPVALCEISGLYRGGTWNRNNVIVFVTAGTASMHRVDAGGGTPTPVVALDKGEQAQVFPWFLPDDWHLLYLSARGPNVELRVASLDSTETTSLGNTESNAMYASGHLLFVRGGTLMARRFNPDTQQPTGDAFPLAEDVSVVGVRGIFSTSTTGVLSYWRAGGQAISRLMWADRTGKTLGQVGEPASYSNFSLSPDGRRVAVAITAGTPINRDIWVIDLARQDTASRLTFDAGREGDPIWSPDGSQVVFNSDRSGNWNTGYVRPSDGSGQDAPLVTMERLFDSPDWSRDGRFIVFTGGAHQSTNDLWMLPMSGDRKPEPFLQTPFSEDSPAFSPDGRWVAYNSNASGRFEVYVRGFGGPVGQFQVSRDGGWAPRWRGDGKEIFFLALDGTMMAASVTFDKGMQLSVPRTLFSTELLRGTDRHIYAVTNDGQRFLLRVPDQRQQAVPLSVVVNWPALAKN